ncbi:MAG: YegS/Rv2252/BmrU family lipid kinase [Flavobacteriales bacterium]|nr:YegS/Rv2252/BmrU family lipid kinase [Flavobacteriales bacterium]
MTRKITILFIINPISGTGENKVVEKLIKKELAYSKFEVSIRYTEAVGHATEIAKEGVKACVDVIVAVGGDGSVNEVAKGLIGTNVKMGIIPAGSGNGFARHLNIPMDKRKAVLLLNKLYSKSVDTASVNDQVFVGTAGVGFDAHIGLKFDEAPTRGFWTYLKLTFKEYFNYREQTYKIAIDQKKTIDEKAFFMSFCNTNQWGNNVFVSPNSDIEDGLIKVVLIRKMNLLSVPFFAFRLFSKSVDKSKYYKEFSGKKVEVSQTTNLIHIDGEPIRLGQKLFIEIKPSSLEVIQ